MGGAHYAIYHHIHHYSWNCFTYCLGEPWKFAVLADSNIVDGDDLGGTADILGLLVSDLEQYHRYENAG